MRTASLCLALMLASALVPSAAAHDDMPSPPADIPHCTMPLLPLYDYVECRAMDAVGSVLSYDPFDSYEYAMALYAAHQAGCHVVGGPACVV